MEKTFLVYIDDVPSFNAVFSNHITIGEIKKYFSKIRPDYEIKFLVNPSTELKVFTTNEYDFMNLETVWDKIDNGSVYLNFQEFSIPSDIGEKTVTTFRQERSYNGYNSSDLKSWLQKTVRRNHPDQAIWAAIELYTLPEQRIVTNLFNRIRIIAMEDIGIANPLVVKIADNVLESLQVDGKPKLPINKEGIEKIAELVSYMARSEHLRAASDYKAVFMTPEKPKIPCEEIKSKEPKILGKRMKELLLEKNDCAFAFMKEILKLKKIPFKSFRSNKPSYYVMSLIKELEKNLRFPPEVDILVKWLKGGIINSKIDYNLPLYYAMLMILKRDDMKYPDVKMEKVEINNFKPNRTILQIPEYVLDKHTLTGRIKGKTALDFAKEGALVENESSLLNPLYREIYLKSKNIEIVERIPKESEIFDFDVRVQATVTDFRSDTYLAIEKATGRYMFVKGPYRNEEEASLPIKIYDIKREMAPELPAIKMEKRLLQPDLFPDLPWGLRRHLDRTQGQWFVVSESLLKPPVPRKIHNTKKWGDVEVIDYSKVSEPKAPKPLELEGKALYLYVLNMLFRYALGIPDEADRNFMLMKDGTVYSIDEEGIKSNTNFKNALREKKSLFIFNYIKDNWNVIGKVMADWLNRAENWVKERLRNLQSIEGIKKIFG